MAINGAADGVTLDFNLTLAAAPTSATARAQLIIDVTNNNPIFNISAAYTNSGYLAGRHGEWHLAQPRIIAGQHHRSRCDARERRYLYLYVDGHECGQRASDGSAGLE